MIESDDDSPWQCFDNFQIRFPWWVFVKTQEFEKPMIQICVYFIYHLKVKSWETENGLRKKKKFETLESV